LEIIDRVRGSCTQVKSRALRDWCSDACVGQPTRKRAAFRKLRERRGTMPQNYVPIFIFLIISFLVGAGTIAIASLVRPKNPNKTKLMPYECGIDPVDNARQRYTIRFYIVAILFVVFDVETVFLFPWAAQYKLLGVFGFVEMLVFLGILIVGFIWIWKKGALEWI
jgi:NADH-quinone oxidoreductase subunit A